MGVTSRRPRLWEAHKTRVARWSSPPWFVRGELNGLEACRRAMHNNTFTHPRPYNRGQTDLNRWIEEEEEEKEKRGEGSIPPWKHSLRTARFIEESRQCCWKSNNNGANALASKNYGHDYDSTILHHRSEAHDSEPFTTDTSVWLFSTSVHVRQALFSSLKEYNGGNIMELVWQWNILLARVDRSEERSDCREAIIAIGKERGEGWSWKIKC